MPETEQSERPIKHRYLTNGAGELLSFLRLTDEPCPACGRGPKPNMLAIMNEEPPRQETVHCVSCDYHMTRRPTPKTLRPMNQRG